MADRIVIGNKDGSTLGVFISKPGSNVFTASSNDLLFDSTSVKKLLEHIAQTIAGKPPPLPISKTLFLSPINFKIW